MRYLAKSAIVSALAVFSLAFAAASAQADFGLTEFDVHYTNSDGSPALQAGSKPHHQTTSFTFNTREHPTLGTIPDEGLKDQILTQIAGLAGDPNAVPKCSSLDFLYRDDGLNGGQCADETQVGRAVNHIGTFEDDPVPSAVYLLEPPPGAAARLGFWVLNTPITFRLTVNPDPPHNIIATVRNVPQTVPLFSVEVSIWGVPHSDLHDGERGSSIESEPSAFVIMPRSCRGALETEIAMTSWLNPGNWVTDSVKTPGGGEPEAGMEGCEALGFDPVVSAAPTTNRASSPSGFDFGIEIDDPGLLDPEELADSDLKKAVVTLPEGMAVNAASAGGLRACTEAQLERETSDSAPGEGCPNASKVATVEVETPLLNEDLDGSIFLAEPHVNPLGTLLAGYLVIKQPERGVILKIAGKIETDEDTGQVSASFDQNPELPFSDLRVQFTGGPRAPLTTPETCGTYQVRTELHPWSGNAPDVSTQSVAISQGAGGAGCTTNPANLPNRPTFNAGTVRPVAGAHSPFVVNLRREDGSQRFKSVRVTPPAGLTAKLAGIPYCSEAALSRAEGRTGKQEQASPSCPSASRVGDVFAAAGSGPVPYWAPGKAYLAGPYKGAPLSMAIVTPAVAGPFDLGNVVIRTALHVDDRTAEITAISDEIPEMLEGIPLDIRRVSIRMNRSQFTLNPTSCDPMQVTGEVTSTRNRTAALSSRFQVGECARLGFEPQFGMQILEGGRRSTLRSFNPTMRFTVAPRSGDANMGPTQITLPRQIILDQGNIRTVCTRDQFASRNCPEASIYGHAKAWTPLLDEPLEGPVYLGSSPNLLPDIIADLKGQVGVVLQGQIDSARGGRMRNTFNVVPDAPVSRFELTMFGGQNRGVLVNSQDLCRARERGVARFQSQHNRLSVQRPAVGLTFRGCRQVLRQEVRRTAVMRQRIVRAFRAGRINRAQARRMLQRLQRNRMAPAQARRAVRR